MDFGDWFGPAVIALLLAGIAEWSVGTGLAVAVFLIAFIAGVIWSVSPRH